MDISHRRLFNHWPRHRDTSCSFVVIEGSDLFDAVKDGPMYWRLWDHAIAADGYRTRLLHFVEKHSCSGNVLISRT